MEKPAGGEGKDAEAQGAVTSELSSCHSEAPGHAVQTSSAVPCQNVIVLVERKLLKSIVLGRDFQKPAVSVEVSALDQWSREGQGGGTGRALCRLM